MLTLFMKSITQTAINNFASWMKPKCMDAPPTIKMTSV